MPVGTAPNRSRPGARPWSRSTRSGTSSKKSAQALDLEGTRARHRLANRRECGDRDQATLERLLGRLEPWGVRLFCTDDWAPYDAALPAGRHYIGKDQTQGSESNNARQRHWFARFRRRTCVVSRSVEMVEATMALFAHYHCNGGRLTPALVR